LRRVAGLRKQKAKTMLPPEFHPSWNSVLESEEKVDSREAEKAQKLSRKPVEFFRQVVGFEPTEYQVDLIEKFLENQFVAARWCRQSGELAAQLDIDHKDISRRIYRINKRMEQEIGENIIEKRGHKWKLIPRLRRDFAAARPDASKKEIENEEN